MREIEAEGTLRNWVHDGINASIRRFPIILGPNDHSGRLDYLARRIFKNRPITIYEVTPMIGNHFVEDAANLLMELYHQQSVAFLSRFIIVLPMLFDTNFSKNRQGA